MENSKSDELELLRTLVEQINNPSGCVLVLGPRVAVRADDQNRQPLDEILARELLACVHEAPEIPPSLRHAAELYCHRSGSRTSLERAARDFYARETSSTTDFHRDLAALPIELCVSASPGHQMETALKQAGKEPRSDYYNFRGKRLDKKTEVVPTATKPLVYYLFGDHDDRQSMVLTEMDLIDYLVQIVKGEPPILADNDASFLFLGFGFHNWYSRVLLKVLNVYGHNDKPVAFEDPEFFHLPEHPETTKFFSGDRLVTFWHLRWEQFARGLRKTYEENCAPSRAERIPLQAEPSPTAPCAFLSYASEDRALVDLLRSKLEANGIRVWQDKQNLRAGDRWNDVLLSVVKNKVDYAIVVQTPSMTAVSGVFHREIKAALEKDGDMGDFEDQKLRFLIPVTIGPCDPLWSLTDFHMIDVSDSNGVSLLVQSIMEDWVKRQKKLALQPSAA
jgi:TIR domain/SIR2-like domain